ncbi:MAG: glycosyl hydrolase family 28-related protein, partial [Candidatus Sumerlaeota bacterium]
MINGDRQHGICVDQLKDMAALGNREMAERGLIDVTAAPFHADPGGDRDSSDAIQDAVSFGREHKMAVFFPAGTYLITRTIECVGGWTEERTARRR